MAKGPIVGVDRKVIECFCKDLGLLSGIERAQIYTYKNSSSLMKAFGWARFTSVDWHRSPERDVWRILFNCSMEKEDGGMSFSYQKRSLFFISLNCSERMQVIVGPNRDPTAGSSKIAPINRSISSAVLEKVGIYLQLLSIY